MSVQLVSKNLTDRSGVIIVQADSQEEATSASARDLALKTAAANGISRPGLSQTPTPYPVDADGNSEGPVLLAQVPVAGYRCDFHIAGML